jgi:hypothetical protein
MACERCKAEIKGFYFGGTIGVWESPDVPAFCYSCGKPHPWTEERLAHAKTLVAETSGLSDDDQKELGESFDEVIKETPKTVLAASRIKRTLDKIKGPAARAAIYKVVMDFASQTAANIITGG